MGKNILILSSVYPSKHQVLETNVVHSFVKEWIKLGYKVHVVNTIAVFPKMYYIIGNYIKPIIENNVGIPIPKLYYKKVTEENYENVPLLRLPMKKYFPHSRFSSRVISKSYKTITVILDNFNFIPDIIIGHWANPQLELLQLLKEKFKVPTVLTLHDSYESLDILYRRNLKGLLSDIDFLGFRSVSAKNDFLKENLFLSNKKFLCPSGIPNYFYTGRIQLKMPECINIIYTGRLIKRKYPSAIINAILHTKRPEAFNLTFIGTGPEESKILEMKENYNLNITFIRHIERQNLVDYYKNNNIFIMISSEEVFGLSYLEAMASGCITIASYNEGMDGIIRNGINGFLCNSGDSNQLSHLLEEIMLLDSLQIKRISENAIETAKLFTDKKAAISYLEKIDMYDDHSKEIFEIV